jgi:hypothetical protein
MRHGYILLSRRLLTHPLCGEHNLEYHGAWVALLQRANYAEVQFYEGSHLRTVKRGQVLASVRYLADIWKWSPGKVQRFIKLLVKEGMVKRIKTESGTNLLEICNYDAFQDPRQFYDTGPEQDQTHERFTGGHKEKNNNTNKEIHTSEIPVFGEKLDGFELVDGDLHLPEATFAKWLSIFNDDEKALRGAILAFAPKASYVHGDSLERHARFHLNSQASRANRKPPKRQSLADKFR